MCIGITTAFFLFLVLGAVITLGLHIEGVGRRYGSHPLLDATNRWWREFVFVCMVMFFILWSILTLPLWILDYVWYDCPAITACASEDGLRTIFVIFMIFALIVVAMAMLSVLLM